MQLSVLEGALAELDANDGLCQSDGAARIQAINMDLYWSSKSIRSYFNILTQSALRYYQQILRQ